MVCASTENEKAGRIAGGFVYVPVASLMAVWWACQARPLGIGDFRTWLALHELVARRCRIHESRDRSPSYRVAELAKLLQVTEKRARASLRRLETAGLIQWSDLVIGFPHPPGSPPALDAIGGGRGNLAIPRRMLRFLAAGARPALIATVLGILLRCLSRRKSGFHGWGRVKASWIARVFAVDVRRVKAARRELVALGWIDPEPANPRAENRWGRAYRIHLAWHPVVKFRSETLPPAPPAPAPDPAKTDGPSLPPPPSSDRPAIATPSVNQEPSLTGGAKNQEPPSGGTGFSNSSPAKEDKPPSVPTDPVPAGIKPVPAPGSPTLLPAPTLADVRLEDLKNTGRLMDLHGQAVAKGFITTSEADRLRFVGAAEHALTIGKENPAGLFAWLVRNGCWRYITQDDEDRANARIKAFLRGPEPLPIASRPGFRTPSAPPTLSSSRPIEPGLSEDARIVREIRAAFIRAGLFRDPWPAFSARYPEWTRARWDAAMCELGFGAAPG